MLTSTVPIISVKLVNPFPEIFVIPVNICGLTVGHFIHGHKQILIAILVVVKKCNGRGMRGVSGMISFGFVYKSWNTFFVQSLIDVKYIASPGWFGMCCSTNIDILPAIPINIHYGYGGRPLSISGRTGILRNILKVQIALI